MRYTISPEQEKFFSIHNYLELEEVVSEEEVSSFFKALRKLRTETPGYPEENLSRSIPLINTLINTRGWQQLAEELSHQRPLKLHFDRFFLRAPSSSISIQGNECGLMIDLEKRTGLFFRTQIPESPLYKSDTSCYFLLIFRTTP